MHDTRIHRSSKARLLEWLGQAERLWIAANIHGLKGPEFRQFASDIGVDRSSAYEVLKLHPHHRKIVSRCEQENHWPAWATCAEWFKQPPPADNPPLLTKVGPSQPPSTEKIKRERETPADLFAHYDEIFHFTLDVAASRTNAKVTRFFTMLQNGLLQDWGIEICWMNPPYDQLSAWCKKAYEAAQKGAVVVALLPAFTESAWFHTYACHAEIEFLRGRLQFVGTDGYAPFASMICVWRKRSAKRGNQLAVTIADCRLGTR